MTKEIYLAGPVDRVEGHGKKWREYMVEEWGDKFDFLTPFDIVTVEEYHDNPKEAFESLIIEASQHDMIVNRIGENAPRTVGTHYEIYASLMHGNDVIAVVDGELKPFISGMEKSFTNFHFKRDLDSSIHKYCHIMAKRSLDNVRTR